MIVWRNLLVKNLGIRRWKFIDNLDCFWSLVCIKDSMVVFFLVKVGLFCRNVKRIKECNFKYIIVYCNRFNLEMIEKYLNYIKVCF